CHSSARRRGQPSFTTRRSSDLLAHQWVVASIDECARLIAALETPRIGHPVSPSPELAAFVLISKDLICVLNHRQMAMHQNEIVRSEEHTSELQSRENLVCRPLL